MTTKFRIILGFAVMLVIIAGLALFSRTRIQDIAESFDESTRSSVQNTVLSDLSAGSASMLLVFNRFVRTQDTKYVPEIANIANKMLATAAENQKATKMEDRRRFYEGIQPRIATQRDDLTRLTNEITELRKIYGETVQPAYHKLYEACDTMVDAAQKINNVTSIVLVNKLWNELSSIIGALGRFYGGLKTSDLLDAKKDMQDFANGLQKLEAVITTENGRSLFAVIKNSYNEMSQAIEKMTAASQKVDAEWTSCMGAANEMDAEIAKMSRLVDGQTREIQAEAASMVLTVRSVMAYVGIGSFIVGIIIATFIIMGLIRTLTQVSVFAGEVAEGNLEAQCPVKEKGEIGVMVQSIR
ncbi:MAG: hypothetical protein LBR22_02965, partial [Desulfovibrio sp.]|nr:hypothetical protein [Desulfovibrio sp.]